MVWIQLHTTCPDRRRSTRRGAAHGNVRFASRDVRKPRRFGRRLLPVTPPRASGGLDVLVVMEGVVGVVLGLDLGEPPVDAIAVGLPNPARVVVGIKEVDVDAASAVRLEGVEE